MATLKDQMWEFARGKLKEGLAQLGEKHHTIFRRMYSPKDLTMPINDVVDQMPEGSLECAMGQIQRTIDKKLTMWRSK